MSKFACHYGLDAAHPEKGIIVEMAADDQTLDMSQRSGCLYLEIQATLESWGRFGPPPAPMGDAPVGCFPSHDELDRHSIPDDHHLRRVAGLPRPDNRRCGVDMRPWAAPDLTPEIAALAKRLEMAAAFDAAAVGGFSSEALGEPHSYPSDADAERRLQLAALAALTGQSKEGWTATLRCAEIRKATVDGVEKTALGPIVGVPHTPGQVHLVLADYQAFVDALHAERDAIEARIAATEDTPGILAITRG